jgi:hypothetical protein
LRNNLEAIAVTAEQLMTRIAQYNFRCDGGPLYNCVDYQKLCVLACSDADLAAKDAEIARCHKRLEIDVYGKFDDQGELVAVPIPMEERTRFPDGISCRDETIKILEEQLADLRAQLAAAEKIIDAYADHTFSCAISERGTYDEVKCTCGLEAALKEAGRG